MTSVPQRAAITAALTISLAVASAVAVAAGDVKPGAYCPFPKKGETPKCLEPAQQEYDEFFAALAEGELSEDDVSRLERDVASGAASEFAYLAISSLSYGYYRLSQQAAADPGEDPAVVARLQRWNELLAQAYDVSPQDPAYRAAVHEAALDLQQRAPGVRLECADESGRTVACTSTEVVLRGFNRAQEQVGLRGALGRLLNRMLGGDDG
jgi:hypothetical protein